MEGASLSPLAKPEAPKVVKVFLLRAFIFFVAWKCVYYFILLPARVPDKQLTQLTAIATSKVFSIVHQSETSYQDVSFAKGHKTAFFVNGRRAIGIADNCNALELLVLYVGFLFAIPAPFRKQLAYTVIGCVAIFFLNVLRCYFLAVLSLNNSSMTDFAHHYVFTTLLYGLIFLTWVRFSKPYFRNGE